MNKTIIGIIIISTVFLGIILLIPFSTIEKGANRAYESAVENLTRKDTTPVIRNVNDIIKNVEYRINGQTYLVFYSENNNGGKRHAASMVVVNATKDSIDCGYKSMYNYHDFD